MFTNPDSTWDVVVESSTKYFLRLYGALSKETSLNYYRYNSFTIPVSKMKSDMSK